MKRITFILIALIIAFSLSACHKEKEPVPESEQTVTEQETASSETDTQEVSEQDTEQNTTPESEEPSAATGNSQSSYYVDIMKSGKFLIHYKASSVIEDETIDAEITAAVDGDTVDTVMKAKEMNTHTIIKGDVIYMLDDANKTYFKMDASTGAQTEDNGILDDTQDLTYVGAGTGTVNGKSLPYEEYSTGDETMRFYMDGKKLYAISSKTDGEEMVMIILELTDKIPSGMLSVPANYKEATGDFNTGG